MLRQCLYCGRGILCQYDLEGNLHFYNSRGDRIKNCPNCGAALSVLQTNTTEVRKVTSEQKNAA